MPADARSVRHVAAQFRRSRPLIMTGARAVITKGAMQVKKQMQSEARGVARAPGMPSAITFDLATLPTQLGFEVGPEKGGAGSLALLYYGNSRTGARLKDPAFALQREAIEIERQLTALMVRAT